MCADESSAREARERGPPNHGRAERLLGNTANRGFTEYWEYRVLSIGTGTLHAAGEVVKYP